MIYCYLQFAKYHYPHGHQPIQVNVRSSLISNASTSCIVADSIIWHTSETIRANAEWLIAKLTLGVRLITEWPTETEMVLPVNGDSVQVVRKYPRARDATGDLIP